MLENLVQTNLFPRLVSTELLAVLRLPGRATQRLHPEGDLLPRSSRRREPRGSRAAFFVFVLPIYSRSFVACFIAASAAIPLGLKPFSRPRGFFNPSYLYRRFRLVHDCRIAVVSPRRWDRKGEQHEFHGTRGFRECAPHFTPGLNLRVRIVLARAGDRTTRGYRP